MSKVTNKETEVPSSIELNDMDCLYTMLMIEKAIVHHLSTIIDEASNIELHDKYVSMSEEVEMHAREAFDLMFKNGWYPLEEETEKKKAQEKSTLSKKLEDLEK